MTSNLWLYMNLIWNLIFKGYLAGKGGVRDHDDRPVSDRGVTSDADRVVIHLERKNETKIHVRLVAHTQNNIFDFLNKNGKVVGKVLKKNG